MADKTAEKLQVTIIGLGLVGASAGLALRRYPDRVRVVGHDRESTVASQAKSMGAVDRTEWNLINAVSGADRVVLAVPINEVEEILKVAGQDFKPDSVILNLSGVNAPAAAWASTYLPESVSLVGGFPVQIAQNLDTTGARADLFEGKLFCLTPDAHTRDTAATLAADLAEAMGAKPFFLDPVEYDGLVAAVEQLPLAMAGALLEATTAAGAWQDMRKLAGSQFYSSTLILSENAAATAAACVANRDNLMRWMDNLADKLDEWRAALRAGDDKALAATLERGLAARERWLQAQATGNWTETAPQKVPGTGEYLRGLIGLRGFDRSDKAGTRQKGK